MSIEVCSEREESTTGDRSPISISRLTTRPPFVGFENWDHALNLQHNYKLDVEGYKTRRFPAVASGSIGERSLTAEIKNGRPQVKERGNVCSAIGRWSHNCRLTGEPNPCFVDCAEEPG